MAETEADSDGSRRKTCGDEGIRRLKKTDKLTETDRQANTRTSRQSQAGTDRDRQRQTENGRQSKFDRDRLRQTEKDRQSVEDRQGQTDKRRRTG